MGDGDTGLAGGGVAATSGKADEGDVSARSRGERGSFPLCRTEGLFWNCNGWTDW